jgi:hypothetical protein
VLSATPNKLNTVTHCVQYDIAALILNRDDLRVTATARVARCFTRSPFLPWLSKRAQSDRKTSFGRRVWFTESNTVLVIFFLIIDLFIHLYLI